MDKAKWKQAIVNTIDLVLDPLNPRINVDEDATEAEIIELLLQKEEIIDLAKGIHREGGLLPGERIITYQENGKHIVLEGNRRTCACKLLLDRDLIPENIVRRIPVADVVLLASIERIEVDVAPNREAAERILTKRHTDPGIKKWSTFANMRRIGRWFDQGMTINDIVETYGGEVGTIRRIVREYKLFKYITQIPEWSSVERARLRAIEENLNPITRFFTLKKAQEILKFKMDDTTHLPTSELPLKIFNQQVQFIARAFLFNKADGIQPQANTRTMPEELLKSFIESNKANEEIASARTAKPDGNSQLGMSGTQDTATSSQVTATDNDGDTNAAGTSQGANNGSTKGTNGGSPGANGATGGRQSASGSASQGATPKPSNFFENLTCIVQNDRLISLTSEIKDINYKKFPLAATMLFRALLESALVFQLSKKGLWDDAVQKNRGMDPGLQFLINYCSQQRNNVFKETRAASVLRSFSGTGFKDHFDFVVHGKWANANANILEQVSSTLRSLITYILNDEVKGF